MTYHHTVFVLDAEPQPAEPRPSRA
jgi:hypothetical protein